MLRFFVLGLILIFSGCSSSNDANNENFAAAILKNPERLKLCLRLPESRDLKNYYPIEINEHDLFSQRDLALHNLLVKEGFEKERIEKKVESEILLFSKQRTVNWKIYEPTEKVLTNLYKVQSIIDTNLALCFGTIQNLVIENFTKPSSSFGGEVSEVLFNYELKDLPEWILNNSDTLSRFANLKISQEKISSRVLLTLTDKGWLDTQDLARIPLKHEKINGLHEVSET